MDIDSVLLSVQERDKWQHRLQLLSRSLAEIRERRDRLRQRLRKIKRELGRLAEYSEALIDTRRTLTGTRAVHATAERSIAPR